MLGTNMLPVFADCGEIVGASLGLDKTSLRLRFRDRHAGQTICLYDVPNAALIARAINKALAAERREVEAVA